MDAGKKIPLQGRSQPHKTVPQSSPGQLYQPGMGQPKSTALQLKRPLAAPPVYRPQPAPGVLQAKTAGGRQPHASGAPPRPVAPPVYRPELKKIVQPKMAGNARNSPKPPPVYRPQSKQSGLKTAPSNQSAMQMKPAASSSAVARPKNNPPQSATCQSRAIAKPKSLVSLPANAGALFQRTNVLQRAQSPASHYGSDYWPPPDSPTSAPPTPSGNYYIEASNYHYGEGQMDEFNDYVDAYEDYTGNIKGQTSGSGEDDNFDESYVSIPGTLRPSAPDAKQLWRQVYAALVPYKNNLERIACRENCSNYVVIDKKTKREEGVGKRPPMCHIIPFNHIRYAAQWLHDNSNSPKIGGNYKGPKADGYPVDTWKKLVWHISNLRPGHQKCNSQTASSAIGNPVGQQENAAIAYVVNRLKILEPAWF